MVLLEYALFRYYQCVPNTGSSSSLEMIPGASSSGGGCRVQFLLAMRVMRYAARIKVHPSITILVSVEDLPWVTVINQILQCVS